MTPQVSRPNFSRARAGRKSVALGADLEGGAPRDASWLPSRVPATCQDEDEGEGEDVVEATEFEPAPITTDIKKQLHEWDPEEKVSHFDEPTNCTPLNMQLGCSSPICPRSFSCRSASVAYASPISCPTPYPTRAPRH